MGNAFLPTIHVGKRWANDKAVCPPYPAVADVVTGYGILGKSLEFDAIGFEDLIFAVRLKLGRMSKQLYRLAV